MLRNKSLDDLNYIPNHASDDGRTSPVTLYILLKKYVRELKGHIGNMRHFCNGDNMFATRCKVRHKVTTFQGRFCAHKGTLQIFEDRPCA